MTRRWSHTNQIVKEFINSQFDTVETLHISGKSLITLVADRKTGEQFVLKTLKGKKDVYRKLKELNHPLLPKIVYAAIGDDETVIVEEYIKGVSVGATSLSEKQALKVTLQLCDILAFLHKQGIIHRDIKPSNIILSDDETTHLIDFDAARFEKNGAESDTIQLGTRGYAAPEQYGFAQTSPRSDIYALGVTMDKLFGEHAKDGKYSKIIAKCTDINPAKRYKNVTEVATALTAGKKRPRTFVSVFIVFLCGIILYFSLRPGPSQDAASSNAGSGIVPTGNTAESAGIFPTEQPSPDGTIGSVFDNIYATDYLFLADNMNFIFLDGKSITIDGKTAEMSVDVDGDGVKEIFRISRDHPNGMLVLGISDKDAENFYYDDWISEITSAFDDFGDIQDGYYAQISCVDLDNDGRKEVLVSIGDKAAEQITAVYAYTGTPNAPFEYKGYMRSGDYTVLTSDMELVAPIGTAGLANVYEYRNNTLKQILEG
jgi:hypothetical protein